MDHNQHSAIAKLQNILKPYKPKHVRHTNYHIMVNLNYKVK